MSWIWKKEICNKTLLFPYQFFHQMVTKLWETKCCSTVTTIILLRKIGNWYLQNFSRKYFRRKASEHWNYINVKILIAIRTSFYAKAVYTVAKKKTETYRWPSRKFQDVLEAEVFFETFLKWYFISLVKVKVFCSFYGSSMGSTILV